MSTFELLPVKAEVRGAVPEEALDLAVERVRALSHIAGGDVQFAQVKLTVARNPAVVRPAVAQVTLRARGRVIRVSAVGATLREAIADVSDRLRSRLEHTGPRRRTRPESAVLEVPARPLASH